MRLLHFIAAVGVGLLLVGTMSAHARITTNALASNGTSLNALASNALTAKGPAVCDLNGVTIETVTLPAALRP